MASSLPFSVSVGLQSDMEEALAPTLQALLSMDESQPFLQPVNTPGYAKSIAVPMDFSIIKFKLKSGDYRDPWLFVNDVWQIFENAWIYHRKSSDMYHSATIVRTNFHSPNLI